MWVLLDTHALFWFIEAEVKSSNAAAAEIGEPINSIHFSPASYREIAIKITLGKWQLNQPCTDFIDIALVNYGLEILNVSPGHTAELLNLPFHHRDPFDHLPRGFEPLTFGSVDRCSIQLFGMLFHRGSRR